MIAAGAEAPPFMKETMIPAKKALNAVMISASGSHETPISSGGG